MSGASGTASTREEATLRRAHRFELAARDMDEVALAATWLNENDAPIVVRRVLLTGIVVSYARPFTKQGVGIIDSTKFAPRIRTSGGCTIG